MIPLIFENCLQFEEEVLLLRLPPDRYGSLQAESLPELCDEIVLACRQYPAPRVVVDLGGLKYYGAALLGALVDLRTRLRCRDQELWVAGDHLRLLEVAHLDRLIPLLEHPTPLAAAVRHISVPAATGIAM